MTWNLKDEPWTVEQQHSSFINKWKFTFVYGLESEYRIDAFVIYTVSDMFIHYSFKYTYRNWQHLVLNQGFIDSCCSVWIN